MLVVTFLGTGNYQPATYLWHDGAQEHRYETHLFPIALDAWLRPERLLVLLTPEAQRSPHWSTLRAQLGERAQPVPIPPGKSEAELWDLFEQLAAAVPNGAELVLDVTHSYRTLPLFAAVAALLLRHLRQVTVARVLYGAFEARDPATGTAPVFDLTPLIDLADWLSGVEALRRSGDGRLLAARLRLTQAAARRRGGEELPSRLKKVADELDTFSAALWLNRPREALAAAHELQRQLAQAAPELARWAPPFALLADAVAAELAPIACAEPDRLDAEQLRAQLALVEYASDKGLVLQAVTMAREWLVSWYLWTAYPELHAHWISREARNQAEEALNEFARALREGSGLAAQLPQRQIGERWDRLAQLRNDLAHCGMRQNALSLAKIRQRAGELLAGLHRLLEGEGN